MSERPSKRLPLKPPEDVPFAWCFTEWPSTSAYPAGDSAAAATARTLQNSLRRIRFVELSSVSKHPKLRWATCFPAAIQRVWKAECEWRARFPVSEPATATTTTACSQTKRPWSDAGAAPIASGIPRGAAETVTVKVGVSF